MLHHPSSFPHFTRPRLVHLKFSVSLFGRMRVVLIKDGKDRQSNFLGHLQFEIGIVARRFSR